MAATNPVLPPNIEELRLIDLFGVGAYNNLDEPKPWSNDAGTLQILTILFLVLSWTFVTFRLYVRLRTVRSAGWDDFFVFLYLVTLDYGAGQHMILIEIGKLKTFLILFYLMNGFFNLGSACIKLSLLFQYLRIFERGTWIWRATLAVIAAVSVWGFTFSFMAFVPCSRGPQFDPLGKTPDTRCWAYGSGDPDIFTMTFNAHTVMNMIFDLVILLLPFQLYLNKTMTTKMRLGLLALLFMGALVNFLSIWRLQTILEHKAAWFPTHDPTWYGPISILLGVLEINVASICASVPIFWPVVAPYLGSIFVTHEVSVQVVEYRDLEDGGRGGATSTAPSTATDRKKQQQVHHQRSDSEIRLNSSRPAAPIARTAAPRTRRAPTAPRSHSRMGSSQSRARSDSVRRKDKWYKI
ncbi:uncharacterized protein PG998_004310 [Apiospora kogelbergensis]|uniref:uncharacterized protein n=1 Tax=Apiospora kogelbergensis TaxID=1337665 RepID=UPI00312FED3E